MLYFDGCGGGSCGSRGVSGMRRVRELYHIVSFKAVLKVLDYGITYSYFVKINGIFNSLIGTGRYLTKPNLVAKFLLLNRQNLFNDLHLIRSEKGFYLKKHRLKGGLLLSF